MRTLSDHKVNGLNEALTINVIDEPGPGGANHHYEILLETPTGVRQTNILFHKGPTQEAGFNGLSNEALMAVVMDRLRGFQSGELATRENALALTKLEESMMWLKKRTLDRVARGVEGTMTK